MERSDRGHDGVETRVFPVTEARVKRAEDGSPQEIVTDVAVFDSLSENLGGFRERVEPGALQPAEDVTSEFNHDPNQIIGRKSAGNLEIEETDDSLKFRVNPVPDTDDARNLVEKIDMGLVQGGSFTFRVHDETWEERDEEPDIRTIREATFFEGGPVTHPAYPATSTELRDTRVAERRHQRFRDTLEDRQSVPEFEGTEDVSPEWADGEWGRPNLSDHPETSDDDEWGDLSESDRATIAGRFVVGSADSDTYADLGYPAVNPANDRLNRNGVLAGRQRASAEGDSEVASILDELWEEHFDEDEEDARKRRERRLRLEEVAL